MWAHYRLTKTPPPYPDYLIERNKLFVSRPELEIYDYVASLFSAVTRITKIRNKSKFYH